MKLFSFGKKEEKVTASCECGNACSISDIEKSKYIVLGACCKKSSESFENVQKALLELGIEETAINIGDVEQIAKYGVMQTPAFVINSKVVTYGKLITVNKAKEYIQKEA